MARVKSSLLFKQFKLFYSRKRGYSMANYYSKIVSEKDSMLTKVNKEIDKAKAKMNEAMRQKAELEAKFEDDSVYEDFDLYEQTRAELPQYQIIIDDCQKFIDNKEEALAVYGIEFDNKITAEQKKIEIDLAKSVKDSIEKILKSYREAQAELTRGNSIMLEYQSIAPRNNFNSFSQFYTNITNPGIIELEKLLSGINELLL